MIDDLAPLPAAMHKPGGMRELLAIAFPMVVSQACETMMMFTDRLFLSRLGPEYMSAAMGGGLTCFVFMTFFLGLTGYANALVAQHVGARQPGVCGRIVAQALILTLLAYPLILFCVPLGHWLFAITGVAPAQLGPQQAYYDILMCGTILGLLRNCFSSFFSGIGQTRIVMAAAAMSLGVNVLANWVLIFGHLGFPALGIRGAAYGTLIGSAAGVGVLMARYFGQTYREQYGILSGLRFDISLMRRLVRLGAPSGAEFFLNLLAFNLLILNFHSYGVDVAAAVTITFNWDMVSFIPLIGVGIGVTSLVGRYMGAGDPDTAHQAAMSGLKLALLYTTVTFTAFCAFPEELVQVFRPADGQQEFAQIVPLAVFMVRLISVYVFADAIGIVFSGALRGAGDTFWTMVISVAGHYSFTVTAAVLIRVFGVGPRTVWIVTVGLVLGLGITFWLRYRTGRWRSMRVVGEAPPPVHEDADVGGF